MTKTKHIMSLHAITTTNTTGLEKKENFLIFHP